MTYKVKKLPRCNQLLGTEQVSSKVHMSSPASPLSSRMTAALLQTRLATTLNLNNLGRRIPAGSTRRRRRRRSGPLPATSVGDEFERARDVPAHNRRIWQGMQPGPWTCIICSRQNTAGIVLCRRCGREVGPADEDTMRPEYRDAAKGAHDTRLSFQEIIEVRVVAPYRVTTTASRFYSSLHESKNTHRNLIYIR